jgi:hypothetical protein
MNRWRAVILQPVVIEFDNPGSYEHVTEQARRLGISLGEVPSAHVPEHMYEARLIEVILIKGSMANDQPVPELPPPSAA